MMAVPRACVLLLLVASLCSHGRAESCSQVANEYADVDVNLCLEVEAEFLRNYTNPTWYSPTADDIQMIPNSTAGTLEVRFPLAAQSKYETYELELAVNETANNQEACSQFKRTVRYNLMHSIQLFDIFKCTEVAMDPSECLPVCNRTGSVTFRHVYSGCYFVKITPKKQSGMHGGPLYSRPVLLETDYVKRTVWNMRPTIVDQCSPMEDRTNHLRLLITQFDMLFTERLMIEVWLNNITCIYGDADSNIAGWVMDLTKNHNLTCQRKQMSAAVPDCKVVGDNSVECIFSNIQPGNYCVTLLPYDRVRCSMTTNAWTMYNGKWKTCRYQLPSIQCPWIVHPSAVQTPEFVAKNSHSTLIVVGAVLACSIIAAAVFYASRRISRRSDPQPIPEPFPREVTASQPRVLLLYAQDCREFMKLMTTFRQLLTNVGRCEVLDCFDPELADEVAASPNEWMRHLASAADVKVVVVASECAVAHQEAMSTNIALQYWDPLPYNHLFLSGLKEVTFNHRRGEYLNTFVVRFDDKDLSYLTPYRRYVLPLHLQELLRSLNPSIDVMTLGEYKDEQKLRDDHSDLMRFKRQNPQYLAHTMAKSQLVV